MSKNIYQLAEEYGWTYDLIHDCFVHLPTAERVSKVDVEDFGAEALMKPLRKYGSTYGPKAPDAPPTKRPYEWGSKPTTDKEYEEMARRLDEEGRKAYKELRDDLVDSLKYSIASTPVRKAIDFKQQELFEKYVLDVHEVGSRYCYSGPHSSTTDNDLLVLCEHMLDFSDKLSLIGWKFDGQYFGEDTTKFISMRKNQDNLILVEDKEYYDKFILAAKICKMLNIADKTHRIAVHDAIISGKEPKPHLLQAPMMTVGYGYGTLHPSVLGTITPGGLTPTTATSSVEAAKKLEAFYYGTPGSTIIGKA